MTHPGRSALVVFLALLTSGCVEEGRISSEPFVVLVQEWKPGFEWRYEVRTTDESVVGEGKAHTDRDGPLEDVRREVVTVMNTTHRIEGQPVYYAWFDSEPLDARGQPLLPGPSADDLRIVRAFRQSDHRLLALGQVFLDDRSCLSICNQLRLAHLDEAQPHLEFPLSPGKTWTVDSDRPDADGPPAVRLAYEVVGRRTLERGPQEGRNAVLIHAQGSLLDAERTRAETLVNLAPKDVRIEHSRLDFQLGADYYWNEQVRNLVYSRGTTRVEFELRGTYADGRPFEFTAFFQTETTRRLASLALKPTDEFPLPPVRIEGVDDGAYQRLQDLYIENDHLRFLTPNAAQGPVEEYFWIASTRGPQSSAETTEDDPSRRGPKAPAYDDRRFEVHWTLLRGLQRAIVAQDQGPLFHVVIERAGTYAVRATLWDRANSAIARELEYAFPVDYQVRRDVPSQAGSSSAVELLRFPIEERDAQVLLEWASKSVGHPTVETDPGEYRLRRADGSTSRLTEPFSVFPSPDGRLTLRDQLVGEYALEWTPLAVSTTGAAHHASVHVSYSYARH